MSIDSHETSRNYSEIQKQNIQERQRTHAINDFDFDKRLEENPHPTDDERRIGAYIESLEPQVRDAILILTRKGYVTVTSGYDGINFADGIQLMGFREGTIDESILAHIQETLDRETVEATLRDRNYLMLKSLRFLTMEEWKQVWDAVAAVFPDKGAPAPFRERFIDKRGH